MSTKSENFYLICKTQEQSKQNQANRLSGLQNNIFY